MFLFLCLSFFSFFHTTHASHYKKVALVDGNHLVNNGELLIKADFDWPSSGRCVQAQILSSLTRMARAAENLESADLVFVYSITSFLDLQKALHTLIHNNRYKLHWGRDFFFGVECGDQGWGNSVYAEPETFPIIAQNVSLISCFGIFKNMNLITFKKNSLTLGQHRRNIDIVVPPEGRCEEDLVVRKSPYSSTGTSTVRDILFFYSGPVKSKSCLVGLHGQRQLAKHIRVNSYECDRNLARARAARTFTAWAARNHRVRVGSQTVLKTTTSFPEASARFCFNPPGKYGSWNTRLKRSILSGCIPVIVNISESQPWEGVLDYEKFSIVVGGADIRKIPEIVESISEEQYSLMKFELDQVFSYFAFSLNGSHMLISSMEAAMESKRTKG